MNVVTDDRAVAPAAMRFDRDYQVMPHLDRYEAAGLAEDEEDYDQEAELDARLRAESEMHERDLYEERGQSRRGRTRPRALEEGEDEWLRQARRRRAADRAADGEMDDDEEFEVNIESYDCPLREWITKDRTKAEIRRRLSRFLRKGKMDAAGRSVYHKKIREMCNNNRQSLEVNYVELAEGDHLMATWVADAPKDMLELFDEVALTEVLRLYPSYGDIHPDVFVRITGLPVEDAIRDIRQAHLDALIRVRGVVTKRTGVFPQLKKVTYTCMVCSYNIGPIFQNNSSKEERPNQCPECQQKGRWEVNSAKTVYRNYQKLTLQESPGNVPAGRIPRSKEVIVLNDLVDLAKPGDEIDVTGVYTNNFEASLNTRQQGFPVFSTFIEANHVERTGDMYSSDKLTDEDREEIRKLSRDPKIVRRIIKSIAPSIHGHEDIKTGIAFALFGGQEKFVKGKTRLRGDINMLLLGDPGVAKSQFLKYTQATANRAVYATGKGASAVGLTAAVHKDPVTREFVLEGGALVLADRGVCLIDEFDKMNEQDRVSIHEAMEQQSISISKAGIVTSLQARCSVIAAANPIGGRYDSSKTFSDNVELTDPILSRFDILCVVRDVIDQVMDEKLARFVVQSHVKSHPKFDGDTSSLLDVLQEELDDGIEPIDQKLLRKYIAYAKREIRPKLNTNDLPKIQRVYAELRKESVTREGMPVAVRHIESIIRMSEARAAMRLSQHVSSDDIDAAIGCMLRSFIGTQKQSVQKSLHKKFARYMHVHRDYDAVLLEILRGLLREALRWESIGRPPNSQASNAGQMTTVRCRDLESKAREYGITDLVPFYASSAFRNSHFSHDAAREVIVHTSQ